MEAEDKKGLPMEETTKAVGKLGPVCPIAIFVSEYE